jgi:type I restriction enzyme S subunit
MILLQSPLIYDQATASTTGTAQPTIPLGSLRNFITRLPPLREQRRIVERVIRFMELVDQLEANITVARSVSSNLLDAIVGELTSFPNQLSNRPDRPKGARSIAQIAAPDFKFARKTLSAEIVHRLHNEPTFGRVKHQKILHLCEHIAQLKEIDGHYSRQTAGPLDGRMLHDVEAHFKKQEWYAEVPRESFGHAYQPLAKAGGPANDFAALWPDRVEQIRDLIELMRRWDTDMCELFATAYAAWNDILIWGREPTDDAILHEVLHRWHPDKRRFTRQRWQSMLDWIRREGYAPTGFGKATAAAD